MTEPRLCPLHGEPLGPPPARNCPACRAAINTTLRHEVERVYRHRAEQIESTLAEAVRLQPFDKLDLLTVVHYGPLSQQWGVASVLSPAEDAEWPLPLRPPTESERHFLAETPPAEGGDE